MREKTGRAAMTLTLTLPPQLESLLRDRAERTGQDIASLVLAILAFGLSLDETEFFEAIEDVQRGLEDFEAGQFGSLEAFMAEQNKKYGLALER